MRRILALGLLVSGCAYTTSTTAVTQIGPDTYSVGGTAGQYVGGSSEARSVALQKARQHCTGMDRDIKVVSIDPAGIRTDVTFQCYPAGDARLQGVPASAGTLNVNVNTRN